MAKDEAPRCCLSTGGCPGCLLGPVAGMTVPHTHVRFEVMFWDVCVEGFCCLPSLPSSPEFQPRHQRHQGGRPSSLPSRQHSPGPRETEGQHLAPQAPGTGTLRTSPDQPEVNAERGGLGLGLGRAPGPHLVPAEGSRFLESFLRNLDEKLNT